MVQRSTSAFTRTELLVVLLILGGVTLLMMFVAQLKEAKFKAQRIHCVSRLKCIGTAFRVFATDNGERYPLEVAGFRTNLYIVPSGAGAGQVNASNAAAWQVAQSMWNQLQIPALLLCPSDRDRSTFSRVTDFAGLAGNLAPMALASLGHPGNRDSAISYAFGVASDYTAPLGVMAVDRNINNVGTLGARGAGKVALTGVLASLIHRPGPTHSNSLSR